MQDSRKARRKAEELTGEPITDELTLIQVVWTLSSAECSYCGKEIPESERSLDHITPMKHGGSNTFDNITCACKCCNASKNDLPAILFLLQSAESREARKLIDGVSLRGHKSFHEAFIELADSAKFYFDKRAEQALRANE
ncbi:HNH endonuclease [Halobacillus campisalis]|uniref:HNH endonuclease n=1 Tax=Halobacillus campisalis TaxID=435909 RepID=A0ABW2K537_9BACI|nr:HNH endonuclease [Halobacillus campisalis]